MNEKVHDSLTETEVAMLEHCRRAMRCLNLTGEFRGFTHPWEGEATEEAIAHAEYLLGVLKPELNERIYGFGKVTENE